MKIVIDIPDNTYEYIRGLNDKFTDYQTTTILYYAVRTGSPLPKGHGRLIDVDALKKEAVMCPTVGNAETLLLDIGDVEHAPTIIEADKEEEV